MRHETIESKSLSESMRRLETQGGITGKKFGMATNLSGFRTLNLPSVVIRPAFYTLCFFLSDLS
jgi:hypothetical protein